MIRDAYSIFLKAVRRFIDDDCVTLAALSFIRILAFPDFIFHIGDVHYVYRSGMAFSAAQ